MSPVSPVRAFRHLNRPLASLRQLGTISSGALVNARQAAAEIALAVYERAVLTSALDEEGDEALLPGQLTRLSREDSLKRLGERRLGRLAYVARAGVPDIVPVNYALDGAAVLIASGPGPKLQAAERRELVAFEVDDIDEHSRTGWSVVIVGYARRFSDAEAMREGAAGGSGPEPWAAGPRHAVIRIDPKRITGRQLH